jgi:hypothetical protein
MNNEKDRNNILEDQQSVGGVSISIGGSVEESTVIGAGRDASFEQVGLRPRMTNAEVAKLFEAIYKQIDVRQDDPNVDKKEITEIVNRIESETQRNEQANPTKIERWLGTLSQMAPDIFDVVIATLVNPVIGIDMVVCKVAEKARQSAKGAQ